MCAFFNFLLQILMKNIEKILKLSEKRIEFLRNMDNGWYVDHKTFLNGLYEEIDEAKEEIRKDNSVYLEDELGDVFWDIMMVLIALEKEWLITREKVFERAYNKFSERIDYVQSRDEMDSWEKIKKVQKIRRKKEHDDLYKK